MNINMDVHFVKGHSHAICEDYGLVDPDNLIMIVADGCSSGRNSDIASRASAHACRKELADILLHRPTVQFYSALGNFTMYSLIHISKLLGLNELLSTLIVAFVNEEKVNVYFYGDGYLYIKYRTGTRYIPKIEYDGNAPEYLWYRSNPEKYRVDGNVLIDGIPNGRNTPIMFSENLRDIELLAILTDGVASFSARKPVENSKFGSRISDADAMEHLINFRSTAGEFVKRRMNRFVREVNEDGFIFDDDLSCAVMVVEGE